MREVRRRGGVETQEDQLEVLMDMFDEALQESERLLGEESDVVTHEALTNVLARYGLIVLLEPSPFVDPLHMTLEERELDDPARTPRHAQAVRSQFVP